MAEQQASHRQELESIVISGNVWNERLGTFSGTLLFLAGLGFAAYMANLGMPWVAVGTFLADLTAFTSLLIWGKRKGGAQLARKRGEDQPQI
jgi:hypothetical protein